MNPPVRYADVDGLHLAYQVSGEGPRDLVLVDEWATPLEARWEVPAIAGRLDRLGSFARLVSFDKRGIGLSDGVASDIATPELWVHDLSLVLDAAGASRPVVMGTHEGGPIAMLYAASKPAETEALVLVNTGPRLLAAPDYPWGFEPDDWHPTIEGIVDLWSTGGGAEAHITAIETDPWWRNWYARSRRAQASPSQGWALMQMLGAIDVRRIVSSIQVPTLIIHRTGNAWWPIEGARWLAQEIPNAQLVELDGRDNLWWAGDADRVVDEIESFLLGARMSAPSHRELATIMFTDIVDSTKRASELGDRVWSGVLDAHDSATQEIAGRFGGSVVKHLGDGHLLRFGGPAVAIRAATELRDALERLGAPSRVALHTGEVEPRGDDLSGIAVHLAARVLDLARRGDILATGVVRGLVAGSGIQFEAMGTHEFKGLPDQWEVHRVVSD